MLFPRLILAGTHSGSGKTTLTMALTAALIRRGCLVQPFKVGPDYIDPAFHQSVAGRPCYALDAWLLPGPALNALFCRHAPARQQSLSLIEGVMGLFDGLGMSAQCSTAHVAALLRTPVVLIVNAEGMSLSAAAVVAGFASFRPAGPHDPDLSALDLAAVIINRAGSPSHYNLLRRSIEDHTGIPCLGYLPKNAFPPLPHRHLGLVPAEELDHLPEYTASLAKTAEECLDIPALLRLADSAPALARNPAPVPDADAGREPASPASSPAANREPAPVGAAGSAAAPAGKDGGARHARGPAALSAAIRIGVALDAAFSFYYQDNLDFLRELGAEPVFFSPLADAALPPDLHGLYLGGGYPEMRAAGLEANAPLRKAVRDALEQGLPAYAECGGMIYLCAACTGLPEEKNGPAATHAMAGFFPQSAVMTGRLQPFGYVTVTLRRDCLLGRAGTSFAAHEFHYSRLLDEAGTEAALDIAKPDGRRWSGGLMRANVFAMYPHLYFRGSPDAARNLVAACRAFRAAGRTDI